MIRKLRIKFILVSMFSMLLVLSVILGIVNVLNYDEIVHDADSVLALLNAHAGELPVPVQAIDWRSAGDRYKSPELPYESASFRPCWTTREMCRPSITIRFCCR